MNWQPTAAAAVAFIFGFTLGVGAPGPEQQWLSCRVTDGNTWIKYWFKGDDQGVMIDDLKVYSEDPDN